MNKSKPRAMEYLWLAVSVLSFGVAIHKTLNFSLRASWLYYLFTVIALLMWFLRKKMRENEDKK